MLVYLQPIADSTTEIPTCGYGQLQHQERKAAAHRSTKDLAILGVIPHAQYHCKPIGNTNKEGGQPMPEQNESPFHRCYLRSHFPSSSSKASSAILVYRLCRSSADMGAAHPSASCIFMHERREKKFMRVLVSLPIEARVPSWL